MAKVKLDGFKCEKCGHSWAPRPKGVAPIACPKCKTKKWNVKR